MGEEMMQTGREVQKRRRFGDNKQSKGKKKKMKPANYSEFDKRKKMDPKMKKLLKRKARDYNSDSDEGFDIKVENTEKELEKNGGGMDEVHEEQEFEKSVGRKYEVPEEQELDKSGYRKYEDHEDQEFEKSGGRKYGVYGKNDEEVFDEEEEEEEDGEEGEDDGDVSEEESGKLQPGIMRFTDGCKVFQGAFRKIIKKTATDDVLGPVLSGNKRLVAEKLAENDVVDPKVKKQAKMDKLLVREKGHVKPETYLDTHEKLLISIATKGVVKLFNAVNKAQQSQKGLNPSRAKDQKALKDRRKDAFFSELGKKSSSKVGTSTGGVGTPAWAPLRDDFMLNKSKLKDWDKNADTKAGGDYMASDSPGSSSGED